MKKLYILLSSLFTLCSVSVSASPLILTSNGNPVKDGDRIEVVCETFEGPSKTEYSWNPYLFISCESGETEAVLTATSDFEGLSICWPMFCMNVQPGVPFVTRGNVTSSPFNMQIHFEMDSTNVPDFNVALPSADFNIEEAGGDSISFSIICLAPVNAGVDSALEEDKPVLYIYNAGGVRSDKLSRGINIVRYSDGSTKKIIY